MTMNRLDFLKALGLSGAALMAALTACQREEVIPTGPVDFDVDLDDVANIHLTRIGGFIVRYGIVVARVSYQKFVAVTHTCSHQQQQQVMFQNGEFYCPAHGARFDLLGKGLNTEAKNGLTTYKIERTGDTLRVYS